jgi:hypothetical protein
MDIQTAAAAAAASSHFLCQRLKRTRRRFHGKNSEVIENIC